MNWYIKALEKYTILEGRSQRSEFWFFLLFYTLGFYIFNAIDIGADIYDEKMNIGFLSGLHILAHIIPFISLSVRRLHDIGWNGWWVLIIFIPIIGTPIFIIFAFIDSKEENKYGSNPKI